MVALQLVAGWVIVIFMAALGTLVLLQMFRGAPNGIDLSDLLSEEESGKASLSRLQFLIFTFVIAVGLLLIILDDFKFPTVGSDVFGLLGISAAGYVGSKIAQKTAKPAGSTPANPAPAPDPPADG